MVYRKHKFSQISDTKEGVLIAVEKNIHSKLIEVLNNNNNEHNFVEKFK